MRRIENILTCVSVILLMLVAGMNVYAQNRLVESVPEMTPDRKVAYAERLIENYYIDDVNGDDLAQEAIIAMLKKLDPHSSYSNPEETKEMTQPLEGNFSGIGIQFNMLNDTLFVIQTTAGGPSEKVGLLAGDKIIRADGIPLSGMKKTNSDIIKTLRGPKGTEVDIEVVRRGVDKPIQFKIVRDDIPINSVDAAYMADPTTGYIKISRFGENTNKEFVEAMTSLLRQGMKNLIIDLEDNGGGYLGSAVEIASNFLNKGDLVTYTESPKLGQYNYNVASKRGFSDGRIVVMVNQYSASASEILSGAIQDNDRGLIVGRRTFGKGLVQRPFPFPDGSMVKLTVSRYHTPSGRSIQKPYEEGNSEDYKLDMKNRYENGEFYSADNFQYPDSLKYYTLKNHRTVYGGGGIMPDLFVPVDTTSYSDYYRDIVAKGVLNRFSLSYVDEHRRELKKQYPDEATFIKDFTVTPAMLDDIIALAKKEDIKFDKEQYGRSRDLIRIIVKGLVGRDLFESSTYYKIVTPVVNPTFKGAIELINSPERYDALIKG